jgi:hypothetical protein
VVVAVYEVRTREIHRNVVGKSIDKRPLEESRHTVDERIILKFILENRV